MARQNTFLKSRKCHNLLGLYVVLALIAGAFTGCSSDWKLSVKGADAKTESNPFSLKVYIENSGSMNGYLCNGAEFKDAIYSYLTALNGYAQSIDLNYINAQTVPMEATLSELIPNLTPEVFGSVAGNHANTDFKQILSEVINSAKEDTVVIFTSDCIMDMPQGSASGFLNITRTDINNIVNQKLKNLPTLSFCIYQLDSKYQGTYYYPKGGKIDYEGVRPVYLWVIGTQENLAFINRNIPNTKIQHGFKNYCSFSPSTVFPATLYVQGKDKQEMILKTKGKNGLYTCKLMMDLSPSLLLEEDLQYLDNYYMSRGSVKITGVTPLPNTSKYTHSFSLEVPDQSFSDLLNVKKMELPSWVEGLNGTRDDSLEVDKTFSIKYIIGGVADAYEKHKEAGKVTLTNNKN